MAHKIKTRTKEYFFRRLIESVTPEATPSEAKVLAFLLSVADNKGKVSLTSKKRKEMIDKLGFRSRQSASFLLGELVTKELIQGSEGEYQIVPEFLWKGGTRRRVITIELEEVTE